MAEAQYDSGDSNTEDNPSESESDLSDVESEEEPEELAEREPCKFYNGSGCRDGVRCRYLHICKYALRGNCRRGSSCKLSHSTESRAPPGGGGARSTQPAPQLTDGRFFQWQLDDGNEWMDIANDHVLEAQYSLPHTKSIKIYNTPYGAVSIDFRKLRVIGKSLKVRRLDDGNTEWIWFCTLRRKWIKYGDKDSKGNLGPVKSADIEQKFQTNPEGSHSFHIGADTFEIRFKEMRQIGPKGKRRVTRRPLYRHQQTGVQNAAAALQTLSVGTKPQWMFEGDSGAWHVFKHRRGTSSESSVSSDDIERKYQQNQRGAVTFTVSGKSYRLDFTAMTQTNLRTQHSRRIKRQLI